MFECGLLSFSSFCPEKMPRRFLSFLYRIVPFIKYIMSKIFNVKYSLNDYSWIKRINKQKNRVNFEQITIRAIPHTKCLLKSYPFILPIMDKQIKNIPLYKPLISICMSYFKERACQQHTQNDFNQKQNY